MTWLLTEIRQFFLDRILLHFLRKENRQLRLVCCNHFARILKQDNTEVISVCIARIPSLKVVYGYYKYLLVLSAPMYGTGNDGVKHVANGPCNTRATVMYICLYSFEFSPRSMSQRSFWSAAKRVLCCRLKDYILITRHHDL